MPNTREDKAVHEMEADIAGMAQRLRPQVNVPRGDIQAASSGTYGGIPATPMPDAREKVTVSHIHKALDQLTTQAQERANTAWTLVGQMTGANESNNVKDNEATKPGGPVFDLMARQITDVARQLERLETAHAAMLRVLS